MYKKMHVEISKPALDHYSQPNQKPYVHLIHSAIEGNKLSDNAMIKTPCIKISSILSYLSIYTCWDQPPDSSEYYIL